MIKNTVTGKKGQTEIIGVAVIILILIIGGVLMVTKGPTDTDERTNDPDIAQSMVNTLMKTKTKKNFLVKDVIRYCFDETRHDMCGDTISGGDCCMYAETTIKNALDMTLGEWNREYQFSVTKGNLEKIKITKGSTCRENDRPGRYTIIGNPIIYVQLTICK